MRLLRHLFLQLCFKAKKCAWIDKFVKRLFQVWYDMPCPPVHYYSPLPNVQLLKRNLPRWYKADLSPGIDWNLQEQYVLAEKIAPYATEIASFPPFSQVKTEGYGPGYGEVEAHLLYMILRYLKPSNVIEVGSGASTFYTLAALQENRDQDHVESTMTCVDPYPNNNLRNLAARQNVHLEACEVQDVDSAVFQKLSENDVLFIDSSHVSKKDSDVDYLLLNILPRLQKGVVIHIHDIPFPMPALPLNHPSYDAFLFWNESALVKAFMMFNKAFQIIMCQSYLHHLKPELLKSLVPIYDPHSHYPDSLWIRKTV